jgi:hypothetical protein
VNRSKINRSYLASPDGICGFQILTSAVTISF